MLCSQVATSLTAPRTQGLPSVCTHVRPVHGDDAAYKAAARYCLLPEPLACAKAERKSGVQQHIGCICSLLASHSNTQYHTGGAWRGLQTVKSNP